jgi:YjbE family integral membrane protein
MATLFRIVLINLVVSCDNVSVIALATRGLPRKQASVARGIGVGLSIALKLLFVVIGGYLLNVTWLHIRIVGGILLFYVTFNMIEQHEPESRASNNTAKDARNGFLYAIFSILAADVSMSLDNVIAVLGVISADGHSPGSQDMALVALGFLVCVPILFLFSETVARVMEDFAILTYLCAGVLIYTSTMMIFEDETIALFLEEIHFTFTAPAAMLCGVLIVIYGVAENSRERRRLKYDKSKNLPAYCVIVLFSLLSVIVISFFNANPLIDNRVLRVRSIYDFAASGSNAIFMVGSLSGILALCSLLIAYRGVGRGESYKALFLSNISGMIVLVLLSLVVCTTGLTVLFGFGEIQMSTILLAAFSLLLALSTYPAVFTAMSVTIKNRMFFSLAGMLYIFVESLCAAIFMNGGYFAFLSGLFPSYFIATFSESALTPEFCLRLVMTALLYIAFAFVLGDRKTKGAEKKLLPSARR